MHQTKVKDVMSSDVVMIAPDETLQEAACKMKDNDCGILPVGNGDNLQGMITDRDIVVRAVCEGRDPATETVADYMTPEICSCKESDSVSDAADIMAGENVSRLIVTDDQGRLCGILSFGSILRKEEDQEELSAVVACATGRKAA